MTKKLCAVYDCLQDGGVIWTHDQPSLPGSPVQAYCYRQGRDFAMPGADEILPALLQLQDLGLALGLQTVPERGDYPRVIKWRGRSQALATAASPQVHAAPGTTGPAEQRVVEERWVCLPG